MEDVIEEGGAIKGGRGKKETKERQSQLKGKHVGRIRDESKQSKRRMMNKINGRRNGR